MSRPEKGKEYKMVRHLDATEFLFFDYVAGARVDLVLLPGDELEFTWMVNEQKYLGGVGFSTGQFPHADVVKPAGTDGDYLRSHDMAKVLRIADLPNETRFRVVRLAEEARSSGTWRI